MVTEGPPQAHTLFGLSWAGHVTHSDTTRDGSPVTCYSPLATACVIIPAEMEEGKGEAPELSVEKSAGSQSPGLTGQRPGISVFFPAYNDAGTIASMVIAALRTCAQLTDDYEVI